jgi:hypothetical protein
MKSFRGVEAGDGMRRREAELRQYTAFYHVPVGQKLLQAQPAITQEAWRSAKTGRTPSPLRCRAK